MRGIVLTRNLERPYFLRFVQEVAGTKALKFVGESRFEL